MYYNLLMNILEFYQYSDSLVFKLNVFLDRNLNRSFYICLLDFSGNHLGIFKSCGYTNVKQYRYWDAQNRTIDFNGMMEDLNVRMLTVFVL